MPAFDLTASIAVELRQAWERLGGHPEALPAGRRAYPLYAGFRKLGADDELLGIIGSYGDTLDDRMVLELLRDWNGRRPLTRAGN